MKDRILSLGHFAPYQGSLVWFAHMQEGHKCPKRSMCTAIMELGPKAASFLWFGGPMSIKCVCVCVCVEADVCIDPWWIQPAPSFKEALRTE